jgi:hypothetical protein
VGGTPPSEEEARALHPKMNQDDAVAALVPGVAFLKQHPESTGKVGAVGFCFGGLMVNRLAVASRELDAGVAYYGRQVPAAQVPPITAPLMLHYAENDPGVNAGIADYEAALKANGKRYTLHMYPGAQHAFNNDTGAARYNKEAADLAWRRTVAFFTEHLGAPRASSSSGFIEDSAARRSRRMGAPPSHLRFVAAPQDADVVEEQQRKHEQHDDGERPSVDGPHQGAAISEQQGDTDHGRNDVHDAFPFFARAEPRPGVRRLPPIVSASHCAARNSRASSPRCPTNWTPSGKPASVCISGTVTAGTPR